MVNLIRKALKGLGGCEEARAEINRTLEYEMVDGGIRDEIGMLALYAIDVLEKPMLQLTSPVRAAIDEARCDMKPGASTPDPTTGGTIELLRCQNCDQLAEGAREVTNHRESRPALGFHLVPSTSMRKLVDAIDRAADEDV